MAISAATAGSNAKIILHHLSNSRSQRILWLLEEIGIPYEIKTYQRTPGLLAPDELKEAHPLGRAPVITDGKVTVAESGAIVEYLISNYGGDKFRPSESRWLDNLYFTHYAEGSLMPLLFAKVVFLMVPKRVPFFIRPVANMISSAVTSNFLDPRLKENSDFLEAHLSKSPTGWFASGDNPTAADFQMSCALEALLLRYPAAGPKAREFLAKVHERPAYKRALEKGGEFHAA